jgi:hypothetical protein
VNTDLPNLLNESLFLFIRFLRVSHSDMQNSSEYLALNSYNALISGCLSFKLGDVIKVATDNAGNLRGELKNDQDVWGRIAKGVLENYLVPYGL